MHSGFDGSADPCLFVDGLTPWIQIRIGIIDYFNDSEKNFADQYEILVW